MEGQRFIEADSAHDKRLLGPLRRPERRHDFQRERNAVLGGITEFSQYRVLLEWAIASRDAGVLLALPNQFRGHCLHPFRNSDSGGLFLFAGNRAIS